MLKYSLADVAILRLSQMLTQLHILSHRTTGFDASNSDGLSSEVAMVECGRVQLVTRNDKPTAYFICKKQVNSDNNTTCDGLQRVIQCIMDDISEADANKTPRPQIRALEAFGMTFRYDTSDIDALIVDQLLPKARDRDLIQDLKDDAIRYSGGQTGGKTTEAKRFEDSNHWEVFAYQSCHQFEQDGIEGCIPTVEDGKVKACSALHRCELRYNALKANVQDNEKFSS